MLKRLRERRRQQKTESAGRDTWECKVCKKTFPGKAPEKRMCMLCWIDQLLKEETDEAGH